MRLSKLTLFSTIVGILSLSTSFGGPNEEPIPDFGPEGPVGFESGERRQESGPFGSGQWQARGRGQQIQILRMTLSKLDLTASQNSKINAVFEKYAEERVEFRSEMTRLQEAFKAARSGTGNDADIAESRSAMVALSKKGQNLQHEIRQSVINFLTHEQEEKFYQIQEQLRQRANRRTKT